MRKVSSPVTQGKERAGVKIQPPVLVLIHIAGAFVLTKLIPLPWVVLPLLQRIGFPLVVLGFLLGLAALITFRRERPKYKSPDFSLFVTSGVYRVTRNPIYLGFLLMLVGLLLNAGSYWGLLLSPLMVFLFNRLVIEPEEQFLAHRFGDQFKTYRSRVRRWI